MKIKKVRITGSGETSLAVYDGDSWVVIKKLLQHVKQNDDRELLAVCSEDLIVFLQEREEIEEKLFSLIREAKEDNADLHCESVNVIPFKPLSYRDFMLSEEHALNSARGFASLMFPFAARIIKFCERTFRFVFPKFKPAKLWYEVPIYYKGNHLSFCTDGDMVHFPGYATWLDYELELGMIITREIHNATEEEAMAAIGGFCVFNDFSIRNVQYRELKSGFGPCKSKDFANAISAVVVTSDEIWPCMERHKGRVYINDQLVATGRLDRFFHSLTKAVAYASMGERIYPGEFMGSGTLGNCCGVENGTLLKHNDTVRIEIDGIGDLVNHIVHDLDQ